MGEHHKNRAAPDKMTGARTGRHSGRTDGNHDIGKDVCAGGKGACVFSLHR